MIIYSNYVNLSQSSKINQILHEISLWISKHKLNSTKSSINKEKLFAGIKEFNLGTSSAKIKSINTLNLNNNFSWNEIETSNFQFACQFTHPDELVNGRLWTTEIGLKKENNQLNCSVLLSINDISSEIPDNDIIPTRPTIFKTLVNKFAENTIGQEIKILSNENYLEFLNAVNNKERSYPIIVVSTDESDEYPVDTTRLQKILIGLAEVYQIPTTEDTFSLEEKISRKYVSFNGVAKIISPIQKNSSTLTYKIYFNNNDKKTNESKILGRVCHYSNLPFSWRHISFNHTLLTKQKQDIEKFEEEFLKHVENSHSQEIKKRDEYIASLENNIKSLEDERNKLRQVKLVSETNNELDEKNIHISNFIAINKIPILDILTYFEIEFSDRIIVLPTAKKSAKKSAGFKFQKEAFSLLWRLSTEYYDRYTNGSDEQAKSSFGKNEYSPNEGSNLSKQGRMSRTFKYKDKSIFMEKHLKCGNSEGTAECLRIHFECLEDGQDEKKIVIGYCGKHLDR